MEVTIEKAAGRARVRLAGHFDFSSSLEFRKALKPLLEDVEVKIIAIDFDKVPFMDSSGLGMLLLLRDQALQAKSEVVLCACSPFIMKMLAVSQFDKLFRIE
jgi:anti-anti-sigma factor